MFASQTFDHLKYIAAGLLIGAIAPMYSLCRMNALVVLACIIYIGQILYQAPKCTDFTILVKPLQCTVVCSCDYGIFSLICLYIHMYNSVVQA